MSEVLQMSNKEETVEVIDFRNNHIRDLFSENLPDVALQKLKNLDRKQNFSGYSRPFKLLTIPNQDDIDFLIKVITQAKVDGIFGRSYFQNLI